MKLQFMALTKFFEFFHDCCQSVRAFFKILSAPIGGRRVDLRGHHDFGFRRHLRAIGFQFARDGFKIGYRILREIRNVNQVKQYLSSLDMAQETISQSGTGMRSIDQSWNVRDYKSFEITQVYHSQVRFQSCKWVIGDLRTRR